MNWRYNLPKCPTSPEDRDELIEGLDPLDYLRGIRDGNIVPTIENLRECLRIVLKPENPK